MQELYTGNIRIPGNVSKPVRKIFTGHDIHKESPVTINQRPIIWVNERDPLEVNHHRLNILRVDFMAGWTALSGAKRSLTTWGSEDDVPWSQVAMRNTKVEERHSQLADGGEYSIAVFLA